MTKKNKHSAEDSALGFLYQGQYALLLLWNEADDDSAVYVETLDDVVLVSGGESFLEQLKHSMKAKPPALTVASVSVWKTLKAWIDVLDDVDLTRTRLHLVAVADISEGSPLEVLKHDDSDRHELLQALDDEANRVIREREDARAANAKAAKEAKETKGTEAEVKPIPHADRAAACRAFLDLPGAVRSRSLGRVRIKPGQPNITKIQEKLIDELTTVIRSKRDQVARQLLEWWTMQIQDLLTKKRSHGISRCELSQRCMEIIREIELDELTSSFATAAVPPTYKHDTMIARQIELVGGGEKEIVRAVREEWRVRQERSKWSTENPARFAKVAQYDYRLIE